MASVDRVASCRVCAVRCHDGSKVHGHGRLWLCVSVCLLLRSRIYANSYGVGVPRLYALRRMYVSVTVCKNARARPRAPQRPTRVWLLAVWPCGGETRPRWQMRRRPTSSERGFPSSVMRMARRRKGKRTEGSRRSCTLHATCLVSRLGSVSLTSHLFSYARIYAHPGSFSADGAAVPARCMKRAECERQREMP